MHYIVDTPYHPRPYYTTLAFLAHDFKNWGWRIASYESNSAYVATFVEREKQQRYRYPKERIDLREIWAREVVLRANSGIAQDDDRTERVASMLRDFIVGLSAFGKSQRCKHVRSLTLLLLDDTKTAYKNMCYVFNAHPIPEVPLGLVSMYMRLLKSVRYTMSARLPNWSHPEVPIGVVDQIKMEFQNNGVIVRKHLEEALKGAMREHPRRIGRVESDLLTTTLSLLVDVTGFMGDLRRGGEEDLDPLPLYEVGEVPPAYVEVRETSD
jgi:hypothetical protein